ncbi:MAG: DegT/DnrJ/EryC1/StrS family aminotransferase [Muribaculaceae bacterium]|nr:DegT/DnrJ/EryC1/StrS family aminotransferase [Muribaculaceae bacterium]
MKKYTFLDLAKTNAPYMEELQQTTSRIVAGGRYIGGEEVATFEQRLAQLCHTTHAIGTSNGLDALRLILRAYIEMGVMKKGDEVIVPTNSFIASALAITDNGLTPIFAEPDEFTHNLDCSKLEQLITPHTRAIMTVHLYGRVSWSEDLRSLAAKYNLKIIEDNAQAIGATSPVAGLHDTFTTGGLGDAAAISFYPTKNVGALGDAGAITTRDSQLAEIVRALANYGYSSGHYYSNYAGLNCRLDPIQAAVLNVKLPHVNTENSYRQQIADIYDNNITNRCVVMPLKRIDNEVVWHQYVIRVAERERFRQYLANNGVETAIHYPTPIHRQPCYKQFHHINLPIAEQLAREIISLPISRCTSPDDARSISDIINQFK